MVITCTYTLPNEEAKARLMGKGGKKKVDIEMVTGANIHVEGRVVYVSAQLERQAELAIQLICKSESHRLAASIVPGTQTRVDNPLLSDLKLAAYYTYL